MFFCPPLHHTLLQKHVQQSPHSESKSFSASELSDPPVTQQLPSPLQPLTVGKDKQLIEMS